MVYVRGRQSQAHLARPNIIIGILVKALSVCILFKISHYCEEIHAKICKQMRATCKDVKES